MPEVVSAIIIGFCVALILTFCCGCNPGARV